MRETNLILRLWGLSFEALNADGDVIYTNNNPPEQLRPGITVQNGITGSPGDSVKGSASPVAGTSGTGIDRNANTSISDTNIPQEQMGVNNQDMRAAPMAQGLRRTRRKDIIKVQE